MKFTAILLLSACLTASADGISQNISLSEKNAPLEKVFKELKRQTGYDFFYNMKALQVASPVTIEVKNATLAEVLDLCFKNQPLSYTIADKMVVVKEKDPSGIIQEIPPPIDVKGRVVNEKGEPVAGATIKVKGRDQGTSTNDKGEFTLTGIEANAILIISGISIETYEVKVSGKTELATLTVKTKVTTMDDVIVNTGYQQLPKERATGSFVTVDNQLINRRVSTDILDRLEDVTSGLAFNKNVTLTTSPDATTVFQPNQSTITIRGRSTINANPNSLIIVDNFPYEGDMSTINPNDVENITVLKDAAAASIWGAFSGNGVIVITTKKGKYNQPVKVFLNSNVTVVGKPDWYYQAVMSPRDYIEIEEYLYDKGFYSSTLSNTPYAQISTVVGIRAAQSAGAMTSADANAAIDALRGQDIRSQLNKYVYQKAVNQQHAVGLSGGGLNNRYFLSAGLDHNKSSLIGNSYQRASIRASNTVGLLKQKLELTTDITFTKSAEDLGNSGETGSSLPYIQLADANGNALIVPNGSGYRKSYTDTAGQGLLLDWDYRPLDEMRLGNKKRSITDYHIGLALKYKVIKGLDLNLVYQYNNGTSDDVDYYSQETYFTRDLINSYSIVNFTAGTVTRPIPLGGIQDKYVSVYKSKNLRGQANYTHTWDGMHELTALAGAEVREFDQDIYTSRLYGYDPDLSATAYLDYANLYTQYATGYLQRIPHNTAYYGADNNYISYFGNAGYTYDKRYIATISARRDESNLFGVKTNQKGVPLWSAGLAWNISNEKFYKLSWLPYLKLRLTHGYQGNVNTDVAAVTTATYGSANNSYGALQAYISNLPNASLRWEKVNQKNMGIDFGSKNNRITGSFDYYLKNGTDLIASSPLDPTTGSTTFTGNTADIKGHGVDIALNTKNLKGKIKWATNFLFNYALDKVVTYKVPVGAISNYVNAGYLNPVVGRPLYSLYSYRWGGLDASGNPQVIKDDKVSTDYTALMNSTDLDDLKYNGPINPPVFGSIRNTIEWNQLSLSFLISYKFGYYFRRASLSYSTLFNTSSPSRYIPDYEKRWKNPGDEAFTNVPSMIYPANGSRDAAYWASEITVERGDHIRLQDIQLNYELTRRQARRLPFQSVNFYMYMKNIGILWRANDYHIDPDFVPVSGYPIYPDPLSVSFGIKIDY